MREISILWPVLTELASQNFVDSMRLFLSEYICSGALIGEDLPPTLLAEGLAMRDAIANDFANLSGVEVVTTRDPRVPSLDRVQSITVSSIEEEWQLSQQLCCECDATFLIAPEFEQILLNRCRIAEESCERPLNTSSQAVMLTGDKLNLSKHLAQSGIVTIPTHQLSRKCDDIEFPCVIKPRDGAGSQLTFLCESSQDIEAAKMAYTHSEDQSEPLLQPFVAGETISTAAIVDRDSGTPLHFLPAVAQRFSDNKRFTFWGGTIPAAVGNPTVIHDLIRAICKAIPGLAGYIGFDLVVPQSAEHPILVEINPRLTTSYVGYRALTRDNLAELILEPTRQKKIAWENDRVTFTSVGHVTRVESTVNQP